MHPIIFQIVLQVFLSPLLKNILALQISLNKYLHLMIFSSLDVSQVILLVVQFATFAGRGVIQTLWDLQRAHRVVQDLQAHLAPLLLPVALHLLLIVAQVNKKIEYFIILFYLHFFPTLYTHNIYKYY